MMSVAMSVAFPRTRGDSAHPPLLDGAVLARCRAQDPMAFRAFVVRYQRMVFALLSRMLGHGPEVEDLAQETFVRAYRAFPDFDPNGAAKPSTWLLTIATRLAIDTKKKKRFAQGSMTDAENVAGTSTPELAVARRELGEVITEAAAALPDDQRAALILAEIHGLSIAEIAAALEVP